MRKRESGYSNTPARVSPSWDEITPLFLSIVMIDTP